MTALPEPIMTSETGSFARKTIEELKPGIIDNLLNEYDYTPEMRKSLIDLKSEMVNGPLKPLQEQTSDTTIWDADFKAFQGKSWLDIPWILAETFFFRRILEAIQYFQPGPWQGKDPFQHLKNREISKAYLEFSETYRNGGNKSKKDAFQESCYQALRGNQSDLSNLQTYYDGAVTSHPAEKFLIDQSMAAFDYLSQQPKRIAYFFDNVGKELYFDLAFIDILLQKNLAQSMTWYLKNQPFFVSDALPKDLHRTIDRLASSSAPECVDLAERLTHGVKLGKITIETPPFLTTGRAFREMPASMKSHIRKHDLAILKGDLNFRKLVSDRHWDPTTSLEKAAGYFPTTFLSLRTLKSELMVGLTKEQSKNLEKNAEKDWLINGKRGMILFFEKHQ
ncbi:MAG: damage-control phosphatase ARMT1 family protein [Chloroflexota bacterium]|nr:damage-control phosphatase ARMT1 family protein [Chloroflexota bacterium]